MIDDRDTGRAGLVSSLEPVDQTRLRRGVPRGCRLSHRRSAPSCALASLRGSGVAERVRPDRSPHTVGAVPVQAEAVDAEARLVVGQLLERAIQRRLRGVVRDRHVRVVRERQLAPGQRTAADLRGQPLALDQTRRRPARTRPATPAGTYLSRADACRTSMPRRRPASGARRSLGGALGRPRSAAAASRGSGSRSPAGRRSAAGRRGSSLAVRLRDGDRDADRGHGGPASRRAGTKPTRS